MFAWKQYEETKSIVFLHCFFGRNAPKVPPETISKNAIEHVSHIASYGEEFVCPEESLGRFWGSFGEALGKLWGRSGKLWGRSGEGLGRFEQGLRKLCFTTYTSSR